MFLKELELRLNRSLWGQFLREKRPFKKSDPKICANIGAVTGILLTAKVRSDFVKPKPNPNIHSTFTPVLENGVATGENKLVCFDPVMKEQMDAEYNMDLKIQSSNWNQYQRHEEGFYRTATGYVEDAVLTYCRMDKRMMLIESTKNFVQFLCLLRSVCAQNNGAFKVDSEFQNLSTLQSAVGFRQKKNISNDKYAEVVTDRYDSAIFTCGKFAFGQFVYDKVLNKCSTPMTFRECMVLSDADQAPIDEIVRERTITRLIVNRIPVMMPLTAPLLGVIF
jgi:hypothetical protein